MLHLGHCKEIKPFWDKVIKFIQDLLDLPPPHKREYTIIFNLWERKTLANETARAILRHAFHNMWAAFTNVHENQSPFEPATIFATTLRDIRAATLAYAFSINLFHTRRRHSVHKKRGVTEESLGRFASLVKITRTNGFSLTPFFQSAIKAADDEVKRLNEARRLSMHATHRAGPQTAS